MTKNQRLAGILLIVGFLSFMLHIVTLFTHGIGLLTIFLVFVYGFTIAAAAIPIYLTFRDLDNQKALFGASGLAAHGLLAIIVCALILAQFKLSEEFVGIESSKAAVRALILSMDRIRTSCFLFQGLALIPLGLLIVKHSDFSSWLGWLGITSGVLIFIGLTIRLYNVWPDIIDTRMLIMLGFGFMLVLGLQSLRIANRVIVGKTVGK